MEGIGKEQQTMEEWTEANDPESGYEKVSGILYSVKRPNRTTS